MTVLAIVGEIVEKSGSKVVVKDTDTGEVFECVAVGDDVLELQKGQTGMFIGDVVRGEIRVKWVHIARLLDPLYEEDIHGLAGITTLMSLVDDPFPALYQEQLAKLQELEEQKKLAELEERKRSFDGD